MKSRVVSNTISDGSSSGGPSLVDCTNACDASCRCCASSIALNATASNIISFESIPEISLVFVVVVAVAVVAGWFVKVTVGTLENALLKALLPFDAKFVIVAVEDQVAVEEVEEAVVVVAA